MDSVSVVFRSALCAAVTVFFDPRQANHGAYTSSKPTNRAAEDALAPAYSRFRLQRRHKVTKQHHPHFHSLFSLFSIIYFQFIFVVLFCISVCVCTPDDVVTVLICLLSCCINWTEIRADLFSSFSKFRKLLFKMGNFVVGSREKCVKIKRDNWHRMQNDIFKQLVNAKLYYSYTEKFSALMKCK